MVKLILILMISFILGVFSIILFSIFKMSSKCNRQEKNLKEDYGQTVYNEIEKLEKEKKENKF